MFDSMTERCPDCDGHFRHFAGCPDYVGEPVLTLQERVNVQAMVNISIGEDVQLR